MKTKNQVLNFFLQRLGEKKNRYFLISGLGIVTAAFEMIPTRLVGHAMDLMAHGPFLMIDILKVTALWAVLAVLIQAMHGKQIRMANSTGEKILLDIRQDVFEHLQRVQLKFFESSHIGRTLAAFATDLDAIRSLVIWGPNTVTSNGAYLLFSAVMIATTDVHMFVAVVWLAPLMTTLNFAYGKKLNEAWIRLRKDATLVSANQAENIFGARVVASFNRQEDNLVNFNELQELNTTNTLDVSRKNAAFQPVLQLIRFLGQAIVLLYGGYRVVSGSMSPGDLVAISLYWEWFMMPSVNFGGFFNEIIIANSAAERILSILNEKPAIADSPSAIELPPLEGRVRFDNVSFSYLPDRPVLDNLSFEIPAGLTVALVGTTGSGKSTILSLLARFYAPQKGRILLDDHDICHVRAKSLHRQLALVLQSNFLFNGSVLENLRYDQIKISEDEIELATRALGAHESLATLKQGYQTNVGESGAALSLGQRQLVSFARALLRNPRILLLDEATSALDQEMDQRVRSALRKLSKRCTTFIVTHRLRTAMDADLILLLENGKIVEKGTHTALLRLSGRYAKMYRDSLTAQFDQSAEAVF